MPRDLPDWYPDWLRRLADLYHAGTTALFLLHGNVRDDQRAAGPSGDTFQQLPEYLATQVFGSWQVVLHYDLARGLRPLAGTDGDRLRAMVQRLAPVLGEPASWPRDPETLLPWLDKYIDRLLLEPDPAKRPRVALLFDYAQYLVPAGDVGSLARGAAANLVRFLNWAQNPYIKQVNIAFVLIADKLADVNDRLVQNPYAAAIEVPMPEAEDRRRFAKAIAAPGTPDAAIRDVAEVSNGLTLHGLRTVLGPAQAGAKIDLGTFKQLKKSQIERQCLGLVEFVEPKYTLDLVVGMTAAKDRLRADAELLAKGALDAAPMGYLVCGPVGTGKTFLAECYAGTVGLPCVKLRNFRSKYVGETEGNLEQVLTVLRSLGPVVVIIDEADAAMGDRESSGDSGTSGRVFSMIASQMGDTRYRGRIMWMLLTCRPDLLPIDLKRQGRAEVHIPLFYPQSSAELREMFTAMAKKNRTRLTDGAVPEIDPKRELSGSDIESVLIAAKRLALTAGRDAVTRADLDAALADFVPSAQGLEKELQVLAAVLECTSLGFLPPAWRDQVAAPDGRATMQQRLTAIRQILEN